MTQTTLLSSLSKALLASKKLKESFKKSKEEKKEKEEKKLEEDKKNLEAYKKYREENKLRKRFRSNKMVTPKEKENTNNIYTKDFFTPNKQINNITTRIIKNCDPIVKELKRSEKMQDLFISQDLPKISPTLPQDIPKISPKIPPTIPSKVPPTIPSKVPQDIPKIYDNKSNIIPEIKTLDEPWDDTCVVMYDILDPNISDKEIVDEINKESVKSRAVNYDNILELEPDQYKRLDEELTEDSDEESDEESNDESDEESVLESNKVCFRNTQIIKLYGNKGIEDLADSSFKVNILNSKSEKIGVVLSFDNSYIK